MNALPAPTSPPHRRRHRLPYSRLIKVKPRQLLIPILQILLGLHAHVEDGTVLAAADDLAVHAALAALALRPQAAEAHLEIRHLVERLLVELADARRVVGAH